MFPKFVWMDPTDALSCQKKFNAIRDKLSSWRFFRWEETEFADVDLAFAVLIGHIQTPPIFEDGKVVYSYGLPSRHSDLADELEKIPDNTMFILMSRPDSRTILYKKASQLSSAKIEEPLQLKDRDQALEWLTKRCESLDIDIDRTAAMGLIDFIGINPNTLIMEAKKLSHLVEGRIYPWAVEQACSGTGDARTTELMTSLVEGNTEKSHELLERTLALGETPIKILAFIASWLRRMYLAKSGGKDLSKASETINTLRTYLDRFRKYHKPEKTSSNTLLSLEKKLSELDPEDSKRQKIEQKIDAEKEKLSPSSEPMFANPWAMKYAIREYNIGTVLREKNGLNNDWPREMMRLMMDIQVAARSGQDISYMLHDVLMYFEKGALIWLGRK
jgi:DNA polymerase III delta subunit